jgi:glycosyltransferase involved in cell wall biosynthesis
VRALYFGTYERDYPRNAEVIACLRDAGVEVIERHVSVWDEREHKFSFGLRSAARIARAQVSLLRRPQIDFDVVVVGYPGHFDMSAARRIAAGRPVVFNPLVSLYDALVVDRGRWRPGSLPARALRWVDGRAMRAADLVVAETDTHAAFFAELAGIPPERVAVCFLGASEPTFGPGWSPSEPFHCLYHGKLIPHHGLETILEAATLVPSVQFRIVGAGQLDTLLDQRALPSNVERVGWVERARIPDELHSAGCALGIFGTNDRVDRVITNKAFESLACGTPLITADTPAARELLVHDESALLVPRGDPDALASAVERLAGDASLAQRLSVGGREAYETHASRSVLGARWRSLLEGLVAR